MEPKNLTPEKKPIAPLTKAEIAKELEKQRIKDQQKVRGLFKFYEVPGGRLEFSYRCYKGDPTETWSFVDGEVREIPMGVARHLNKSGSYPVHAYAQDADGKTFAKVGRKIRRYGFQSLEFIDDEDLQSHQSEILSVSHI